MIILATPIVSVDSNRQALPSGGIYGAYQLGNDTLANDVRNAGISHITRLFRWEQIEPEQDVFHFNGIDTWIDEVLKRNNLYAIVLLRTGQCWATDNSYDPELGIPLHEFASAPPLDYDDYYDYIYTIVNHLNGRVNHFIIENDPLTRYSWYATPEEYKQLVSVAYQAAKAANPKCVVIGNKFPAMGFAHLIARDLYDHGLEQEAIDFWNGYNSRRTLNFQVETIEELLEFLNSDFSLWISNFADVILMPDQAQNLDAIGFNYYLQYSYIDEVVAWLYFRMNMNGYSLPLWDLEHGIKDERNVVSDFAAAGELVKGYVTAKSLGIQNISWYPFTIDTSGHNYEDLKPMYDFENQELLPTYYAMMVLSDHLSPYHLIQDVFESIYVRYSFENVLTGRVDLEAIWSDSVEAPIDILFRRPATQAIVTHLFGIPAETVANSNDTLVVEVNSSPLYIKWIYD
ncbi:MAG: hypothetical protein ACE5OP_08055 [Candidatus Glassbacteria bacterium]